MTIGVDPPRHLAHERRADPAGLVGRVDGERRQAEDAPAVVAVDEVDVADHHMTDHRAVELGDERVVRPVAVRRPDPLDERRLRLLPERASATIVAIAPTSPAASDRMTSESTTARASRTERSRYALSLQRSESL